ncbi:MAG TPA: AI-2E family transporter [Gaiellaceae bacterium]|nr:AI-2E family transporter [Gaiellaceae bacterium]
MSTARRSFTITAVAILTIAGALALWKLRELVALLFLSLMIASAMRPGVDRLAHYRIPRIAAVLAHYAALLGLIALVLWMVIPQLLAQVESAIGNVPQTRQHLAQAADGSTGIKHDILVGLQKDLTKLPTAGDLVHPAIDAGKQALEILVGIFFVLASAAYWIYERDRFVELVASFVDRTKRKTLRDTWDLVELKLGAYVRAMLLMICIVGSVLSFAFWQIGLPYWLLLGLTAALMEIIPVVGPLAAGVLAVAAGLTVSVEAAVLAAVAVYGLRLIQDYLLGPRVLGGSVGIAPLAVLICVFAVGLLFGAAYVPLSTPFLAVVATVVDVLVRGARPTEQEVPSVVFSSSSLEEYRAETRTRTGS